MINMNSKNIVPQGDNDLLATEALAGNWKVGGYYNYCAASAGSYCYASSDSSGRANESICSKGWRLPTGNTGETATLYSAYSNGSPSQYIAFRTAFRLPLPGYFIGGSAGNQGGGGSWWTSTRSYKSTMYRLYADASGIYPAYDGSRSSGNSVRCLAQ